MDRTTLIRLLSLYPTEEPVFSPFNDGCALIVLDIRESRGPKVPVIDVLTARVAEVLVRQLTLLSPGMAGRDAFAR